MAGTVRRSAAYSEHGSCSGRTVGRMAISGVRRFSHRAGSASTAEAQLGTGILAAAYWAQRSPGAGAFSVFRVVTALFSAGFRFALSTLLGLGLGFFGMLAVELIMQGVHVLSPGCPNDWKCDWGVQNPGSIPSWEGPR